MSNERELDSFAYFCFWMFQAGFLPAQVSGQVNSFVRIQMAGNVYKAPHCLKHNECLINIKFLPSSPFPIYFEHCTCDTCTIWLQFNSSGFCMNSHFF